MKIWPTLPKSHVMVLPDVVLLPVSVISQNCSFGRPHLQLSHVKLRDHVVVLLMGEEGGGGNSMLLLCWIWKLRQQFVWRNLCSHSLWNHLFPREQVEVSVSDRCDFRLSWLLGNQLDQLCRSGWLKPIQHHQDRTAPVYRWWKCNNPACDIWT